MASRFTLSGKLTAAAVHSAATQQVELQLSTDALEAVARNRDSLTTAIEQGGRIYGINTGLGALASRQVAVEESRRAQVNVLRSHAAGMGAELPREVVRAAVIVRLNGLLQAHSGVRPLILTRIAGLLNAGFTPVVPQSGSLGASGDLAPSAHAFLPLIGEGEVADAVGQRLSGAEALRRMGWEPLALEAKEALALVNGTHFMAGIGALLVVLFERLLDSIDAAAALSIDALAGAMPALDARVHALRRLPGQAESAHTMRTLLNRSQRVHHAPHGDRVQDAYSLRCAAQVHGAAREALDFLRRIVDADLNAVTDNPLVFDDPAEVVSAGNFHGQSMALALDTARIAMADLGSISERRTFRLLSPSLNGELPSFLSPQAGPASGYMVAQYTAAALLGELRSLAHPVSADSVPTSDNQEDHVSMGMTAATMALEAAKRLHAVIGIELLCAAQAIDCTKGKPGVGTAEIHELVRSLVPPLVEDRPPAADMREIAELVADGRVASVVKRSRRRAAVAV